MKERLNKWLSHAGIASRRQADLLITSGRVKVNGEVIRELGTKIDPAIHHVYVDDHPIKPERLVYWLVNKPRDYVCTNSDPDGRPRAIDLIPHVDQRVYTVGRLDLASEGLLLMTNDGNLAEQLMHPKYGIEKSYEVVVAGSPSKEDLQQLTDGIWLHEGKIKVKSVRRLRSSGTNTLLRIILNEGKNREIRRLLAKLGHKVLRLKRVAIGSILLDRLPKGKSRRLTEHELEALKKILENNRSKLAKS